MSEFTVILETIAWVKDLLESTPSGQITAPAQSGETVGQWLKKVTAIHPRLHASLWEDEGTDQTRIGPHIEVLVNDTILDTQYTLNTPLSPGDKITLMGQYIGG